MDYIHTVQSTIQYNTYRRIYFYILLSLILPSGTVRIIGSVTSSYGVLPSCLVLSGLVWECGATPHPDAHATAVSLYDWLTLPLPPVAPPSLGGLHPLSSFLFPLAACRLPGLTRLADLTRLPDLTRLADLTRLG